MELLGKEIELKNLKNKLNKPVYKIPKPIQVTSVQVKSVYGSCGKAHQNVTGSRDYVIQKQVGIPSLTTENYEQSIWNATAAFCD